VHDVAAAEDEDAALAQRTQPRGEIAVIVDSFQHVDRQLQDRDVGLGEHVHERDRRRTDEPMRGHDEHPREAAAPRPRTTARLA
jgi:hypothetical protein